MRCGLPFITLGVNWMLAQDHETGISAAPVRRRAVLGTVKQRSHWSFTSLLNDQRDDIAYKTGQMAVRRQCGGNIFETLKRVSHRAAT